MLPYLFTLVVTTSLWGQSWETTTLLLVSPQHVFSTYSNKFPASSAPRVSLIPPSCPLMTTLQGQNVRCRLSAMCHGTWRSGVPDGTGRGSESTEKVGSGPWVKAVFTMFPGKLQSKELGFDPVICRPCRWAPSGSVSTCLTSSGSTTTRSPPSATTVAPCSGASCGRVCSAKVRRWVLLPHSPCT